MPNMGLLGVSDFGTRKIQDHFWMDFVDVLGLWVDVLGCYPCFLRIGMIWDVIHVFWGLAWFCDFVTKSWSGMVADLAEIRVFSCSSLQREVKYPPRIRVFVVLHWVVPYLTLICGILGLGTSAVRDCVDGKFWDFLEYFGISWNILGFLGIRGCWDVEFHI